MAAVGIGVSGAKRAPHDGAKRRLRSRPCPEVKGNAMPTYISLSNFTHQGIASVKDTTKRAEAFKTRHTTGLHGQRDLLDTGPIRRRHNPGGAGRGSGNRACDECREARQHPHQHFARLHGRRACPDLGEGCLGLIARPHVRPPGSGGGKKLAAGRPPGVHRCLLSCWWSSCWPGKLRLTGSLAHKPPPRAALHGSEAPFINLS